MLKCETIRAGVPVERLHRGDVAVTPEHVLAEHHVGQGRGQACGSLRGKVVVMLQYKLYLPLWSASLRRFLRRLNQRLALEDFLTSAQSRHTDDQIPSAEISLIGLS